MPVLKIKKSDGTWQEVWGSTTSSAGGSANMPRLTNITLFADQWAGDTSPYGQDVNVNGVNVNSKLDLQPTPSQLDALQDAEISLMAVNNEGRVIVYSFNGKPDVDMEMQVLITDVEVIV